MKPIDFLTYYCHYNDPVGAIMEALRKKLVICSANAEWEVLSYYYSEKDKRMVLDIQKKGKTYRE